jgi:hypothetical protein
MPGQGKARQKKYRRRRSSCSPPRKEKFFLRVSLRKKRKEMRSFLSRMLAKKKLLTFAAPFLLKTKLY